MLAGIVERLVLRFKAYLLDPHRVSRAEKDIYFNREYARPASEKALQRIAELEAECDRLRRENATLKTRGPYR